MPKTPLPREIWEPWEEPWNKMIAMYKRVAERNKRTALRSRQLNKVATEQLQNNLKAIDCCSEKMQQRHSRKLELIQSEMEELYDERCYLEQRISLGRLSGCHLVSSRSRSANTSPGKSTSPMNRKPSSYWAETNRDAKLSGGRWYPKTADSSVKCQKSSCSRFPCKVPSTYHSFGHESIYQDWQYHKSKSHRTKRHSSDSPGYSGFGISDKGDLNVFRQSLSLTPRIIPECSYLGFPSARVRLRAKEEQLLSGMRGRDKVQRPEDWSINYGKPVSCRRLLKPVIPVSASF